MLSDIGFVIVLVKESCAPLRGHFGCGLATSWSLVRSRNEMQAMNDGFRYSMITLRLAIGDGAIVVTKASRTRTGSCWNLGLTGSSNAQIAVTTLARAANVTQSPGLKR
ncbi:hypothetical protein CA13_47770 [Planctomycetes bacterium CA13]|uniref:Uncharacterized protein n=1 Tax=Novipirellula herctigrandis TaxID=2527986 RepID=A0A5C5Z7J3_9BACT|nr:hypothetical protein CA13_47770 [Planctomycetes bacterium CA13]